MIIPNIWKSSSLWDWYMPHIQPYRRLTFDPTPIQTAQAHIRPYPNENKQPLQQKTTCIRSHSTLSQLLSGMANFQPRWGGVGVLGGMLTFSHTCKPNTTHLRAAWMLTFPSTSKPKMAHFQAHRGVVGLGWGGMLTFNVKHLQAKDGTPPGGLGYVGAKTNHPLQLKFYIPEVSKIAKSTSFDQATSAVTQHSGTIALSQNRGIGWYGVICENHGVGSNARRVPWDWNIYAWFE